MLTDHVYSEERSGYQRHKKIDCKGDVGVGYYTNSDCSTDEDCSNIDEYCSDVVTNRDVDEDLSATEDYNTDEDRCVTEDYGTDEDRCVTEDYNTDEDRCVTEDYGTDEDRCVTEDYNTDEDRCVTEDYNTDEDCSPDADRTPDDDYSVNENHGTDDEYIVDINRGDEEYPVNMITMKEVLNEHLNECQFETQTDDSLEYDYSQEEEEEKTEDKKENEEVLVLSQLGDRKYEHNVNNIPIKIRSSEYNADNDTRCHALNINHILNEALDDFKPSFDNSSVPDASNDMDIVQFTNSSSNSNSSSDGTNSDGTNSNKSNPNDLTTQTDGTNSTDSKQSFATIQRHLIVHHHEVKLDPNSIQKVIENNQSFSKSTHVKKTLMVISYLIICFWCLQFNSNRSSYTLEL
jgi:hypothetical protein